MSAEHEIKAGFNIKVEVLWAMPVLDIREKPNFAEKTRFPKCKFHE